MRNEINMGVKISKHIFNIDRQNKPYFCFLIFQIFELRSTEELTEEWVIEKLKLFR